jgi:hypothetical protein
MLLAGLTGCADLFSGPTQDVSLATSPKAGARCMLANGEGSWTSQQTPSVVTIASSETALDVSCQTADGWKGQASFPSSPVMSGDGVVHQYPVQLDVAMIPPPPDPSPTFGLEGGKNISAPLAPIAQNPPVFAMPQAAQPVAMTQPLAQQIDPAAERTRMEDDNVVTRFQTLRVLLDEGLITREEYNARRGANLGALLHYSLVPSARDLIRPAPPPRTLVQRLRYLAAAYAEHSISASEQAAERAVILDGLLPVSSIRRADPPPPITDQMQLGAEIGRIERLRVANVITDAEAAKEKAKAAQLLDASIAAADAAARAAAGMAAMQAARAALNSGIGVALATYSSEAQARRGWAGLQKAHPSELGQLGLSLKKIPRPHRPTHYQIVAGPLPDHDTAVGLCKSLRKSDLFCDAAVFGE